VKKQEKKTAQNKKENRKTENQKKKLKSGSEKPVEILTGRFWKVPKTG
jgi:hypothetical protein